MSNEIQHIDIEYTEWVAELKQRYRNAQLKAAVKVNSEKLLFNWLLGADLVLKKAEERWGEGIVEKLSKDLQNEFPNTEGFTIRNLQSMKQWYLFYSSLENEQKLKQAVSQFPNLFAYIGWSHHITIIQKCKDIDEALFYILKTIENNWSREGLKRAIAADIYHKQVSVPNNFTDTLVRPQSGLLQAIKNNPGKFPAGYTYTLNNQEVAEMRSKILITNNVALRHTT